MIELDLEGLQKHREQTVFDILELLKTEDRVGCVRYTGYGKSYFVMRRLIEELDEKVLIVVPNSYLYWQYIEIYENMENVKVLTYQSLYNIKDNKLEALKGCRYIIADECHHILAPIWNKEFERIRSFLKAKVIGLTATPVRGDSKDVINVYFAGLQVQPLQLADAIANNYVNKIKYIVAYAQIDDKYNKKLNEIDRYNIKNLLNVSAIIKKHIPKEKLEHNLKIPVYVPRVKYIAEAKEQCYKWFSDIYPDKKINIYSISSDVNIKRNAQILNKFKTSCNDNDIDILVSIDMLKEGLHLPTMGVEIMLRKTISPVTYFQQIGRVINDNEPIIFDFINNQSHLYTLKKEYKVHAHKENWGTRPQKIMFDDCIMLIDETVEIESILHNYTYDRLLLSNKERWEVTDQIIDTHLDFLVKNCKKYSYYSICKILNLPITPWTLKQHLAQSKYSSYNLQFKLTKITKEEADKIVLENAVYIRENPNHLNLDNLAESVRDENKYF